MADAERDLIGITVRGISRSIILWLVSQKPMSGYGIMKEMRRLTGQNLHSGIVYPLLYELEEKGLLTGEWVQKGRRRVKYYSITEKGMKLLNRLRKLLEMPVKETLKDLMKERS